ncbi:myosin-9-like [Asterias rubens]|uniref:myosin-9-like n=1 Tax=Asterias rubens TaxID=7604 RepID=UPI001455BAF1|nr:myosin-9-like [Asterias rubens]
MSVDLNTTREDGIVKLSAATNNSSSEDLASSTTTTTEEDLPSYHDWYWHGTPPNDTDHTSLFVQASSSSRSFGDQIQGGAVMIEIPPNILDSFPSSSQPSGSANHPLDSMERSALKMNRKQGRDKKGESKVCGKGRKSDSNQKSTETDTATSSNHLNDLNNLQAELDETRTALELTEEQLTLKMDENDEAAEEIDKAWHMIRELQTGWDKPLQLTEKHSRLLLNIFEQIGREGGPERAWLCQESLQDAIIHLYKSRENARFAKKLTENKAKELSKHSQLLQSKLQCLTTGLHNIVGKMQQRDGLFFDMEDEGQDETSMPLSDIASSLDRGNREDACFSLLDKLKSKLHRQDLQAARWQSVTAQLRRELELSRQRCEAKMESLWDMEEECRKRKDSEEMEKGKVLKQEELIKALTKKISECNLENEKSNQFHSELEGRIKSLAEQLQNALKNHQDVKEYRAKVSSLEEQLEISKTRCKELWEQHHDMESQLLTTKMDKSDMVVHGHSSDTSNCSDKLPLSDLDSLMSSNAMQGIHQQFDKHMSLVQDLEKERQKAHQLRDVRLAGIEVTCMNEQSELSKERDSCQAARKLHEEAQCKLDTDRRTLEERVQKMTESLLHQTEVRGRLTSDLTQTKQDSESTRRQLVAATTALEYERQARDVVQTKFNKLEEEKSHLERQVTSLQQDHQLSSQKSVEELAIATSELKQATEDLHALQNRATITMATQEIESSAKLKEGAMLVLDLERRLDARTTERKENSDRIKALEARQLDYDQNCLDLQTTRSRCEELQSQVNKLQSELSESQSSLEEMTAQKQQLEEERETLQDYLNTALSRHSVLKKKLRKQNVASDSALRSLEEERDELTNQVTEGSKNLTNLQQQLKSAQECKVLLSADKQKLTSVINAIKDQRKLDKDKLQRALIKTNELKEQLAEEKTMASDYHAQLTKLTSRMATSASALNEERSKATSLSAEVFTLRDTAREQKNQIVELTGEVQNLQFALQSVNHKHELEYSKLVSYSEKTISKQEQTCGSQEEELQHVCKENQKMAAELNLLNEALNRKRSDYSQALFDLHKSEMKIKEMVGVIRQLEGQLDIEKNVQEELNKSHDYREAEMQKLRKMKKTAQDKMEQLQNTVKCNTKIELQHIKAELTREIFSKIETSTPTKQDRDNTDNTFKLQELEGKISKLEGLRSVDKLTIASLNEDVQKLQKLLIKQRSTTLKHRPHGKPRKDDIQAALAKAHVRALSMSMAENYHTQSPLFENSDLLFADSKSASSAKKMPSYSGWDTNLSDSGTTCSSDEFSS